MIIIITTIDIMQQYASRNDQYKSLSNRLSAVEEGRNDEWKESRRTISVPNALHLPKEIFLLAPPNDDIEDQYGWILDSSGCTNATNQN